MLRSPYPVVFLFAVAAVVGCNLLGKRDGAADGGAAAPSVAAATPPKGGAAAAPGVTAPAATPLAGSPDLAALLGTKADGWNPKVFAGLKEGMAPAAAGKIFKWADAVDANGIADVPVGDVKGVQRYRFTYLEGKLKFAEIWFHPSLGGSEFRDTLVKVAKAKWGDPEPAKGGDDTMWIAPDFHSATVSKIIDLSAKGYAVQVALN